MSLTVFEVRLSSAVDSGNINRKLAEFLLTTGKCLLDYAKRCNHPEMFDWMLDCGYSTRKQSSAVAGIRRLTKTSRLDCMQRVAQLHSLPPTNVTWLNEWQAAINTLRRSGYSVSDGTPNRTRSLREIKTNETLSNFALLALYSKCRVEMLMYTYEHEYVLEVSTYRKAILFDFETGDLNVVKWLLDHLSLIDKKSCNFFRGCSCQNSRELSQCLWERKVIRYMRIVRSGAQPRE
ncbi:hypothetical protein GN244_ATG05205 [Phytophthora infestans]|uniref:Uncharacterized protein n=1 Tax=Phytophthora infestans TaxID=4787 RepID=A0A833SXH6_PHYIN|nr:hypothetical protein GN244_ATG05205 [Phytophthora infestans]